MSIKLPVVAAIITLICLGISVVLALAITKSHYRHTPQTPDTNYSEITLAPGEKFLGISGHSVLRISTRPMLPGETPQVCKVYSIRPYELDFVVTEQAPVK